LDLTSLSDLVPVVVSVCKNEDAGYSANLTSLSVPLRIFYNFPGDCFKQL